MEHDNERHALYGGAAVRSGTPDYGRNGDDDDGRTTDAGDAIANVLHWLAAEGGDVERALDSGRRHFEDEIEGAGDDGPGLPDGEHRRRASLRGEG